MYYERGPLRSHTQLTKYFETLIGKGLIDIRSAEEASEFFRGMPLHQRYIDQLYLDSPVPSAEEVSVRARHVVDELQNGVLHLYPDVGHAPQIEIPDQFHADLIRFLKSDPDAPASEWE